MAFHRLSNKLLLTNGSEVRDSKIVFSGTGGFDSVVDLNNHKITSVAEPTANSDAATKLYVDSVAQGLTVKNAVSVATKTTLTTITNVNSAVFTPASGTFAVTMASAQTLTIDDISMAVNDRILVKNQTKGFY